MQAEMTNKIKFGDDYRVAGEEDDYMQNDIDTKSEGF